MSKTLHIHEWILTVKYWSLVVLPRLATYLIFSIYVLIGVSIVQEIEIKDLRTPSSTDKFQQERDRLLIKLLEKRQTFDLQQYTKYVSKHLRQYEQGIRKHLDSQEVSPWNFSKSLFFIITTLTTIGSNELIPQTKSGKLFLMIYTCFGIPLTLIFINDLSHLIEFIVGCLTQTVSYASSSYSFPRRGSFPQFSSLKTRFNNHDLTLVQLVLTLLIYTLFGTYFLRSASLIDGFYLCFTTISTVDLNISINSETNLPFVTIYLFVGLAIIFLFFKTIKKIMEKALTNLRKTFFRNLLELSQKMDLMDPNTDPNSPSSFETVSTSYRATPRTVTLEQQSTMRPVGIAEPLRRLSTGLIRAFKTDDSDEKYLDKSVQVSTIIRRCGRCAETCLPILPVRQYSAMSSSSSASMTDNSSGAEDDDVMDFPPPNLDRIRQRRATLVAKTIINQMATQPRSSSIEDFVPPLTFGTGPRYRSADSSPAPVRCSIKVSSSTPPDTPRRRGNSQEEFLAISRQISALLTPSDDEN